MAQYVAEFSGDPENTDPPTGTTKRGNEGSNINARVNAEKSVEFSRDNTDDRNQTLTLDAVDSDPNRANAEILSVFQIKTAPVHMLVRGLDQGDGRVEGPVAQIHVGSGLLQIGNISGSAGFVENASTAIAPVADEWWAARYRVAGDNVHKVKAWETADRDDPEADEPDTPTTGWMVEITDATYTAVGWAGVGHRTGGSAAVTAVAHKWVVATNGETATFGGAAELTAPTGLTATTDEVEQSTLDWTNTRADLPTPPYRRRWT